jgi:hypothetical protein
VTASNTPAMTIESHPTRAPFVAISVSFDSDSGMF